MLGLNSESSINQASLSTETNLEVHLQGGAGGGGRPGKDGKSAYQIAVENGFIGTEEEWLASLKGKDGKDSIDASNYYNKEQIDKQNVRYYKNVEEMKADSTLKDGMTCITQGYYEPNDGGGAEYIKTLRGFDLVIKDNKLNVKQFGAKGDGITDDTSKIKESIEKCKANKKLTLFFAKGNNFKVSQPLKIPNGINILMEEDALITYTGNGICLELGDSKGTNVNVLYKLNIKKDPVSNFKDESIGVKIWNTRESNIIIDYIDGFQTNINFHADHDNGGNAWNNIYLGAIKRFKYGLHFTNVTKGWNNANIIYGGSFTRLSNLNPSISSIGVIFENPDGSYPGNNSNVFYGVKFESGGNLFLPIQLSGTENIFQNCRFENTDQKKVMLITKGNKNKIIDSHITRGTSNVISLGYSLLNTCNVSEHLVMNYSFNDYVTNGGAGIQSTKFKFQPFRGGESNDTNRYTKDTRGIKHAKSIGITTGVGLQIDTSSCKRFMFNPNTSTTLGYKILIKCFAKDGSTLSGSARPQSENWNIGQYAKTFEHSKLLDEQNYGGNCYITPNAITGAFPFEVSEEVDNIKLYMVGLQDNDIFSSMSLYAYPNHDKKLSYVY